jgi:hypothetical protein
MRQPLDHTRHGVLGTTILSRNLIADVHNVLPILRGEVLVSRLGYMAPVSVFILCAALIAPQAANPSHAAQVATYRRHHQRHSAVRETFLHRAGVVESSNL